MTWFSENIRTIIYNHNGDVVSDGTCREFIINEMSSRTIKSVEKLTLRAAEGYDDNAGDEIRWDVGNAFRKPLPIDALAERFTFFLTKPKYSFKKQTMGWDEDEDNVLVCHQLDIDLPEYMRNILQLTTLIGMARVAFAPLPTNERPGGSFTGVKGLLAEKSIETLRPRLWKLSGGERGEYYERPSCGSWGENTDVFNHFQLPLAEWVMMNRVEDSEPFGHHSNEMYHSTWTLPGSRKELFDKWIIKAYPKWKWKKCNPNDCWEDKTEDDDDW